MTLGDAPACAPLGSLTCEVGGTGRPPGGELLRWPRGVRGSGGGGPDTGGWGGAVSRSHGGRVTELGGRLGVTGALEVLRPEFVKSRCKSLVFEGFFSF